MKKIKDFGYGITLHLNDVNEYEVRIKTRKNATYFTNDLDDAEVTAKAMMRVNKINNETEEHPTMLYLLKGLLPEYMTEDIDFEYDCVMRGERPDLGLSIGGCSTERDNSARRYAFHLMTCTGYNNVDAAGALNVCGVPANTSNSIAFEVSKHVKHLEEMKEVTK